MEKSLSRTPASSPIVLPWLSSEEESDYCENYLRHLLENQMYSAQLTGQTGLARTRRALRDLQPFLTPMDISSLFSAE